MRGYVGVTDRGWHAHLLTRQQTGSACDEVNFWSPGASATFQVLQPGEAFFFRLKAPVGKIAGIGFFQRFVRLPVWLAWDSFGEGNGAGSLAELRHRLNRLSASIRGSQADVETIGCRLLSNPVFFPPDAWVDGPEDWSPNIVSGKGYDLTVGEGRRIWDACRERLMDKRLPAWPAPEPVSERYGTPRPVAPRLGQGGFRIAVLEAYRRACAVTGEHSLPVLEAAHIQPYADAGRHDVRNGLLLRTDIHRLFDRGYVTVTPDLRFRVSERLRADFDNGRTYYALDGATILTPNDTALQPDRGALEWHGQTVYLG